MTTSTSAVGATAVQRWRTGRWVLLVLVGGVLLMVPGFLTDIIGFLFLLPMTRPLARSLVAFFVARSIRGRSGHLMPTSTYAGEATIIRGETVGDPQPAAADDPVVISGEVTDGASRG